MEEESAPKLVSAKGKDPEKVSEKRRAGKLLGITPAESRKRNIRAEHLKELEETGLLAKGDFGSTDYGYLLAVGVGVVAIGGVAFYLTKVRKSEKVTSTVNDTPPETLPKETPTNTPKTLAPATEQKKKYCGNRLTF